jgi:catalase
MNGPKSFKGRKVGALVTDGVDAGLVRALREALEKEGAMLEIICPKAGGVTGSDGSMIEGDEAVRGGPSVLYDAVAVLPSDKGIADLLMEPAARDFVADAFAHYKFVAYTQAAELLFAKAGLTKELDDGFMRFDQAKKATDFVKACRALRFWDRQGA